MSKTGDNEYSLEQKVKRNQNNLYTIQTQTVVIIIVW